MNPDARPHRFGRRLLLFACALVPLVSFLPVRAADPAPATDRIPTQDGDLTIRPINHATFVMEWKKLGIYVDPVGGSDRFQGLPRPDLVLLTDIHSDHLHVGTLQTIVGKETALVAPAAVAPQLPPELRNRTTILTNGQTRSVHGLSIEALPAYNTSPDRLKYHTKGRGNGYLLSLGGKRLYISGDTEDIPEMRALRQIDVAFVCMNLPYTMTVEQAASAVLEFKPKIVYPYHSRGSNLDKFKQLVAANPGIEVRLRSWY